MCAQWAGATRVLRRAGSGRHGRVLMKIDRPGEPLAGYASGPAAATQATGLARAAGARAVVLVEGVSDQIAVETLAGRRGRRLGAEGVTVLLGGSPRGRLLARGPHV